MNAPKHNDVIMRMARSSGSEPVDMQLVEETGLELENGWAVGPFCCRTRRMAQ